MYFSETEQRRENMEGNCRYNNNLVGPIKCPIEELKQNLQILLQIVLPNNQEILNVLKYLIVSFKKNMVEGSNCFSN
jgi:hypothetical protein